MKEVTVHELKKMMDGKEDFQLIDVREPHEHQFTNIGGELIPMGRIFENVEKISREKKVIFYCRTGNRSGNVVKALEQRLGQNNLYNLKGGIIEWADEIDDSITKY
ncbi:MAG TPA: rhodanese-like domain-containing protein [Cyclobacteriaceae bacterium]|nr:rhodanese-like domain-containing protein [Cyclobacteriaceae bacterium]